VIDEHSIPQRWKEVLTALQKNGFPEAIIAGGALRDLDHGREIKDVDIFVLDHGPSTEEDLEKAFGYAPNRALTDGSEYHIGRAARPVTQVYEFEHDAPELWFTESDHHGTQPFQVIVLKQPERSATRFFRFPEFVLADFDLGICRIYYDGRELVRTHDYRNDEIDKVFRSYIPLTGKQLDLTKERVARLLKKYPDFTSNLHYQEEPTL
jgi:hypothetical protein